MEFDVCIQYFLSHILDAFVLFVVFLFYFIFQKFKRNFCHLSNVVKVAVQDA